MRCQSVECLGSFGLQRRAAGSAIVNIIHTCIDEVLSTHNREGSRVWCSGFNLNIYVDVLNYSDHNRSRVRCIKSKMKKHVAASTTHTSRLPLCSKRDIDFNERKW